MSKFDHDKTFADLELQVMKATKLMLWFAARTPARITIRQALAFLLFAEGDVHGAPRTVQFLRDLWIPDAVEGKAFATALTRSFAIFFEPDGDEPHALGWLYSVIDEEDKRNKVIRLTDKGKTAYRELLATIA